MLLRHIRNYPKSLWTRAKILIKRLLRRLPGFRRLVVLGDRMALLEQSLAVLRASLQSKMTLQENRLRRLSEHGTIGPAKGRGPAAHDSNGLSASGLEFLLAHARLPAPPGRILDVAGMLDHGGLDLASLGYEIHRGRQAVGEANAWNAILCRLEEDPADPDYSNAEREKFVASAVRGLRTGGRLIISLPSTQSETTPAWLAQLPAHEIIRARRDDSVWRFDADRAHPVRRGEGLILGIVEKS